MLTRRSFLGQSPLALLGAGLSTPFLITAAQAAPQAGDAPLKIRDLYDKGAVLSPRARALDGTRIAISGFMAPPLKADAAFFVLTKMPMATCPFCEPGVEWPDTILPVYSKRRVDVIPFNVPIEARGVLRLSEFIDPETGFWSIIRLEDARYARS
ncbi:hypothetical protein [Aquimixticola soesokkakensis]|nr:hypothetical protein [Aquimixticola soesokkakensis]